VLATVVLAAMHLCSPAVHMMAVLPVISLSLVVLLIAALVGWLLSAAVKVLLQLEEVCIFPAALGHRVVLLKSAQQIPQRLGQVGESFSLLVRLLLAK
jgi:hypothetical protein